MSPLRLNLGCGPTAVDGWVNVDRSPNVILDRLPALKNLLFAGGVLSPGHMASWPRNVVHFDVRKGLPYPEGSVEAIYSSHMLEHLYLDEARGVLQESRRVLARGGILRLALPDSEQLAANLVNGVTREVDDAGLEFNLALYAYPMERPSLKSRLVGNLGANVHRWQPTRSLVKKLLEGAGFQRIEERQFLDGELPDLSSVEHRQESFFIEAT